jgi:hypothetical protein
MAYICVLETKEATASCLLGRRRQKKQVILVYSAVGDKRSK